ncbi:hypothetical protein GCM10028796_07430 [Ramlibacter monticola]|uniref:DUF4148 domain-containing protein n=1 Tax=Ramlibacter monticola TaxID=1926872 RepID=A0A936YS47_9BURK|nr:hypothetical protein [Ramlibacter monticola]MBL0389604.1 hypothetical protein [Ramlibacter monticola]
MTKLTPALCGLAALLAFSAYAQQDLPGEDRAAPSEPATRAERQAARERRHTLGREMGKNDEGRVADQPVSAGKRQAAGTQEKLAARAGRKAAGTEVVRSGTGRVPEADNGR